MTTTEPTPASAEPTPASAEPTPPAKTTHRFEAEVEQVLRLVVHSLYSNKEIFLRELLSNASDALDKLRFRSVTEPHLLPGEELRIRIEPDAEKKTLTIWDDGVGMSREELAANLGTIAKSGTRELAEALKASSQQASSEQKKDLALIGQFGVGFYSAFLVAQRVEVISRAAGSTEAWRWESDAKSSFTLEPATRDVAGTSVVLHLEGEALELLRTWKLEELVRKYSDFLQWPIEIRLEREKEKESEGALPEYRRINRGTALWQRPTTEVTAEQYQDFYEHLAHAFDEKPLAWKHFKVEGSQEFAGILYIPRRAPLDLFAPDTKHGVRLYVKRVFIMEDCDEVLPRWLRFVRGVVDSEDLPLNVSREILQDSRLTKIIRKQVIKQTLDMLAELAGERPEDYALFWRAFGAVLKEGLHFEPDQSERLAKLLRFETSAGDALSSLADLKSRMKEGQKGIYYAIGESRKHLESSPHLESLRARGLEVIYLTDPVDSFAIAGLNEHDGVPLLSATAADADLGPAPVQSEEDETALKALRDRMRVRLQDHVSEVRASARLVGSPACLVVPPGGLAPHIERLLRTRPEGAPPAPKRILEINPEHPMITSLRTVLAQRPDAPEIDDLIALLFEQALIAEGTPLEDPGGFTRRLTALLTQTATRAAAGA
jgi:molecular chaperone HtpG